MFPFGVYDKDQITPVGDAAWQTHYEALLDLCVSNHLNTFLLQAEATPTDDPTNRLFIMDQCEERNLSTVMSVGNAFNSSWDRCDPAGPYWPCYSHETLIALKYGDEPSSSADLATLSSQYGQLRLHTDFPVITALVGELMTFGESYSGPNADASDFAQTMWDALETDVRFARHYHVRRDYTLETFDDTKIVFAFFDWCNRMETIRPSDWWWIAQTFGRSTEKIAAPSTEAFWRVPTARELTAMCHGALAYGARGIIGFQLQDFIEGASTNLGLVADDTLTPITDRDGTVPLTAFAAMGQLTTTHEAILGRHTRGEWSCESSNSHLLAVPRFDPVTEEHYLYVVNKDAEAFQSGTITFPASKGVKAYDIYTRTDQHPVRNGANMEMAINLSAGDGRFFRLGKDPVRIVARPA